MSSRRQTQAKAMRFLAGTADLMTFAKLEHGSQEMNYAMPSHEFAATTPSESDAISRRCDHTRSNPALEHCL